ncbi:hypothetical protein TEA_007844 [Camellia sinensis var. sinensis]|uniref:Uncharacterized protein n=1 Tax=Camellia sinensis var. sinensis TaxID=542762 RepID=A0A4S4EBK2_CAMSN|nr:hypothetical protein TEA_007844 [Camellia sinensis var. sinensis]
MGTGPISPCVLNRIQLGFSLLFYVTLSHSSSTLTMVILRPANPQFRTISSDSIKEIDFSSTEGLWKMDFRVLIRCALSLFSSSFFDHERRQSLGRISSPTIGNATKHNLIAFSSSAFSTSAGGGGGRGRGRGSSNFEFTVPTTTTPAPPTPGDGDGDENDPKGFPSGMGHGRCKPLLGTPILPSFSSFISSIVSSSGNNNTTTGRGRASAPPLQSEHEPKRPIFFSKEDATDLTTPSKIQIGNPPDSNLPSSILSVLSGAGRGKPSAKQLFLDDMPKEENYHLRSRHTAIGRGQVSIDTKSSATPKLSRGEAVKKAVGILSRGSVDVADRVEDGGTGTGSFRGRGTRGGGRGRGWRGRGRGAGRGGRGVQDADDDYGAGLYLGDNADGEKLAKRIGPENMNKLVEGFEEMSGSVLPSPMDDAYLDALHTNFMIECEPEYLMEEFGTNPVIDEKPPIPLRDALEKMKPFLMAYEGIQSQEEWEVFLNPILLSYFLSSPDMYVGLRLINHKERNDFPKILYENAEKKWLTGFKCDLKSLHYRIVSTLKIMFTAAN